MPKIELLVGMIGSGKTTYAKARAADGALTISHDDLTEMLHCEYRYEPQLREVYKSMMRSLAFYALEAGRDVVLDRTHLTRESRLHWTDYAHAVNRHQAGLAGHKIGKVEIVAVTFPILAPAVHARRRFEADDRGRPFQAWLEVAQHHFEQSAAEPLDMLLERFHDVQKVSCRAGGAGLPALPAAPGEPA